MKTTRYESENTTIKYAFKGGKKIHYFKTGVMRELQQASLKTCQRIMWDELIYRGEK